MPAQEKGIREMSGKPRGGSGEPEQDSDRGTENIKGPVLCEDRIAFRDSVPKRSRRGTRMADPVRYHVLIWENRLILYLDIPFFLFY